MDIDTSPMDVSPWSPLVDSVLQDAPALSPVVPLVSSSLVIPNKEGETTPAPAPVFTCLGNPTITPTKLTTSASFCPVSPVSQLPQVPNLTRDTDGDSIMEDIFNTCVHSIDIDIDDAVRPVETVVSMAWALVELNGMEITSDMSMCEPSQGIMDSEERPGDIMSDEQVPLWTLDGLSPLQMEATSLPTELGMVSPEAEPVTLSQEILIQEEPTPTMQEEPVPSTQEIIVPFVLREPAVEMEGPNVKMDKRLVPLHTVIQPSTPLPFAILANSPLVLPKPPTPRVQQPVHTFQIDVETIMANFSKPLPKTPVSIQSPSISPVLTCISASYYQS